MKIKMYSLVEVNLLVISLYFHFQVCLNWSVWNESIIFFAQKTTQLYLPAQGCTVMEWTFCRSFDSVFSTNRLEEFSSPLSQYLILCYSSSPGTSELCPVPPVKQLPLSKRTWRAIRSVTYAVEMSREQSSFSGVPHSWNPLSEYTSFIFIIPI